MIGMVALMRRMCLSSTANAKPDPQPNVVGTPRCDVRSAQRADATYCANASLSSSLVILENHPPKRSLTIRYRLPVVMLRVPPPLFVIHICSAASETIRNCYCVCVHPGMRHWSGVSRRRLTVPGSLIHFLSVAKKATDRLFTGEVYLSKEETQKYGYRFRNSRR
jgi:hypothetical protein